MKTIVTAISSEEAYDAEKDCVIIRLGIHTGFLLNDNVYTNRNITYVAAPSVEED